MIKAKNKYKIGDTVAVKIETPKGLLVYTGKIYKTITFNLCCNLALFISTSN